MNLQSVSAENTVRNGDEVLAERCKAANTSDAIIKVRKTFVPILVTDDRLTATVSALNLETLTLDDVIAQTSMAALFLLSRRRSKIAFDTILLHAYRPGEFSRC